MPLWYSVNPNFTNLVLFIFLQLLLLNKNRAKKRRLVQPLSQKFQETRCKKYSNYELVVLNSFEASIASEGLKAACESLFCYGNLLIRYGFSDY